MYRATQPVRLAGFWDTIKDAAGDVWRGSGAGDTGVRDVIITSASSALDTILYGSREQVARVLEGNLPDSMRRDLERAYMERRAREFGPWIAAGAVVLVLLLRRR